MAGRPLGPIRPGGIAAALLLAAAPAASAQQPTWSGIPAVDSASAARSAWRDAGRALRAGDTVAAGRAVSRAARADYAGVLAPEKLQALDAAVRFALGLD